MKKEISYLLRFPSEEIMKAVLQEALNDLKITEDEDNLNKNPKNLDYYGYRRFN